MSLNDPQWGKRGGSGGGNEGPPDLDEMWRNFNQKLNRIFSRRRGAGGTGAEPPSFRNFGGGIGLLAGLILVIWLASGLYIVVEGQRGVVLTFGKFSEITNSGLRWRLPYPIQSHEIVDLTGVRTVEVGYRNNVRTKVARESLMLTDDENIIDIQFAVQYTLKDPTEYLFNNRRPEESVLQAAETATREIVGKSKMDYVLYEGREQVAAQSQQLMQDILDRYKTGISISKVTMQNAQPPEQVQGAFDDAVRAKQDLERQKNEGQAYYNDVVPKARGTASRLFEEANGYRQSVIQNAEGEASRFRQVLSEYNRAPGVMRDRLYIETLQQILSSTTKVLVDSRAGSNLLYLPLDKLMQITGASTSTCLPLTGFCYGNGLIVEGEVFDPNRVRPFIAFRAVAGGYTDVMRMPLLRGRSLTRADVDRQDPYVVVNKVVADAYFPGQDPIGRRVRSSVPPNSKLPTPPWWTIVGVVANTPTIALGEPVAQGLMFQPMSIAGGPDIPREALVGPDITAMSYIVRSSVPSSSLVTAVRRAIDEVDPSLAIAQVRMLQDIVDRALDQMSFTMILLAIAAAVALLLGAIGIYGVISYIVAQRTGEIGVRLAMGAEPGSVARMILRQGGQVTLAGIIVGLIAALAGSQLIRSLLFGTSPRDPMVFSLTTVALLVIALLACWLPARKASRLSPLEALRTE